MIFLKWMVPLEHAGNRLDFDRSQGKSIIDIVSSVDEYILNTMCHDDDGLRSKGVAPLPGAFMRFNSHST